GKELPAGVVEHPSDMTACAGLVGRGVLASPHGAEQRVEPGFAAVVALADRMPPTVAGKANLGACHMIQAHRCRQPSGGVGGRGDGREDRKSTRLNSSHVKISYAVFCLKKKKK